MGHDEGRGGRRQDAGAGQRVGHEKGFLRKKSTACGRQDRRALVQRFQSRPDILVAEVPKG
jgi:predicted ABC-type transport system involved in lysophospholipase L1 biosynthesis ATPase subunit